MHSQAIISAVLFALPALTAYVDVKRDSQGNGAPSKPPALPACGPNPGPCTCPKDTFYQTSTTMAFFPAAAKDITAITGNFLDIDWFGIHVSKTEGQGTTVGAKRHAYEPVPQGVSQLLVSEQLLKYTSYPDGGFYYQYEGIDLPLKYKKTDGTEGQIGGSWEFMDVKSVTGGWTSFVWGIHACLTDVWELAEFHEGAMKNVSSILKSKGQLKGDLKGPFSF